MKKTHPAEVKLMTLDRDVSDTPVSALLIQQSHDPNWEVSLNARWVRLQSELPNIARYISLASLEASPDDAIVRQQISRQMIGLVMLLEEDALQHQINQMWAVEPNHNKLPTAEHLISASGAAA